MSKIEEARELLEKNGQAHIKVNNEELAEQILKLDFNKIKTLYSRLNKKIKFENVEPVKAINPDKLPREQMEEYKQIGEDIIKQKKFAVAIMAGGQGTRLGHHGPKGTFKVKINNTDKYLFEIIIEKLLKAKKEYNVYIPCYIMTSSENNSETIEFFEKNNFFGYPKEYVNFFIQEDLPLLDEDGKLILGEDRKIKLASEGNGGIFCSMKKKKIITEMKRRNIEWIFIGAVDNLLAKYVDTLLLGLTVSQNTKIATRTVIKSNPCEKVGVICKQNNKIKVVEYTEIPEEMRTAVNEDGEMLFGESHIMCNLFNIKALEIASTNKMKYHAAHKKTNYIDNNNRLVIPKKENCYKFEKFIFDSFELFDNITILRGKRAEDFAPIKNSEGQDSPETAIKLYEAYITKKA